MVRKERSRWRWLVLGLLLVAMAMVVSACGDDDEGSTATSGRGGTETTASDRPGEGLTIGFAAINCANPTACAVERAFRAEAERLGAKANVLEVDLSDPINSQIKNVDQLVTQGVDAIAYWPLQASALRAPTQRAEQAGIPVFAHDYFNLGDDGAVSTEGSGLVSDVVMGRTLVAQQAAKLVCEQLTDGGDVIYGNYGVPAPTTLLLRDRFAADLRACSDGRLSVAQSFDNKTDNVAGAKPAAQAALQKFPDTKAIVSYNDETAIGSALAARDLGIDPDSLLLTGYNLSPTGVRAIESGQIDASWDYRPVVIGQALARVMVEYAAGVNRSPPAVITVWPKCYTQSTIGELPSWDEQLSAIAEGVDLAAEDPALLSEGDSLPDPPPSDIPGCELR